MSDIFAQLTSVIEERKRAPSKNSYTARLLAGGLDKIGGKVLEEAAELIEAAAEAGDAGRQHAVREAADLVYHLLVLLACREITLADVEVELERRFGTSGLDEKARRAQGESSG